jgi:hypothetical protein
MDVTKLDLKAGFLAKIVVGKLRNMLAGSSQQSGVEFDQWTAC